MKSNAKLKLTLIAALSLGFVAMVIGQPQQGPMAQNQTMNQSMQDWMVEHRQMQQHQKQQMQQLMDQMDRMERMMQQMMGQQGMNNRSGMGQGMMR